MNRFLVSLSFVAIASFANTSEAQRRDRGENIPAGYLPPAGKCRIWIDGMPRGVQNKPMDCDAAERAAKARTHIIYGSEVPFPTSHAGGWSSKKHDRWSQRLPEMQAAILYQRGERSKQLNRWVGERDLRVEAVDMDNNGRPERATWLNRSGKVLQVWTDQNRDGRADRLAFYDNGKLYRVIE